MEECAASLACIDSAAFPVPTTTKALDMGQLQLAKADWLERMQLETIKAQHDKSVHVTEERPVMPVLMEELRAMNQVCSRSAWDASLEQSNSVAAALAELLIHLDVWHVCCTSPAVSSSLRQR